MHQHPMKMLDLWSANVTLFGQSKFFLHHGNTSQYGSNI